MKHYTLSKAWDLATGPLWSISRELGGMKYHERDYPNERHIEVLERTGWKQTESGWVAPHYIQKLFILLHRPNPELYEIETIAHRHKTDLKVLTWTGLGRYCKNRNIYGKTYQHVIEIAEDEIERLRRALGVKIGGVEHNRIDRTGFEQHFKFGWTV